MAEQTPPPPAPMGWPTPTTDYMPPKKRDRRLIAVSGVIAAVVLVGALASMGGGSDPETTPEPTRSVVAVASAVASAVAATPTPTPTPEPTLDPDRPITMEELEAAVAAKDCAAIMEIGTLERIAATDDSDVLTAGIDATSHCLGGDWTDGGGSTVPIPMGQSAVADDGIWKIKVTGKPNWNAWKVVKRENMFNEPAPRGMQMVMIPLAFTNVSDETQDLLGLGEYVIGDATGIEVTDFDDPTCGVIPKEVDFFRNVRPGGTLKGNMCFVVDKADVQTLRLGVPVAMFSDEDDIEFALR